MLDRPDEEIDMKNSTKHSIIINNQLFRELRVTLKSYLLVISNNLPPILHRFRDIPFDRLKSLCPATPLAFNTPDGGVPLGRSLENFT